MNPLYKFVDKGKRYIKVLEIDKLVMAQKFEYNKWMAGDTSAISYIFDEWDNFRIWGGSFPSSIIHSCLIALQDHLL